MIRVVLLGSLQNPVSTQIISCFFVFLYQGRNRYPTKPVCFADLYGNLHRKGKEMEVKD